MKRHCVSLVLAAVALMILCWIDPALVYAQWVDSVGINTPVSVAPWAQQTPVIVSDGVGGAIIVWKDERVGGHDFYAQCIDRFGFLKWKQEVRLLSSSWPCEAISDGKGGAIIAFRGGPAEAGGGAVMATRVGTDGNLVWNLGGQGVSGSLGWPLETSLTTDGEGGAIFVWIPGSATIRAQRVDASGTLLWTTGGKPVCGVSSNKSNPKIITDGEGGAIIAWQDNRRQSDSADIFAQRIDAFGVLRWQSSGVLVSDTTGTHTNLQLVSDCKMGAIAVWSQSGSSQGTYARRINHNGNVQWTAGGPNLIGLKEAVSDGSGGIFIGRTGGGSDPWAKIDHILSDGQSTWGPYGLQVGGPLNRVIPDGAGGIFVLISPVAYRLNAAGIHLWPNGRRISRGKVYPPVLTSDMAEGLIAAWQDNRADSLGDIYAQRVGRYGDLVPKPLLQSVQDVPADQGGKVTVRWRASDLDMATSDVVRHYSIWRALPPASLQRITAPGNPPQDNGARTFRLLSVNGIPYYWEWLANEPKHNFPFYSYTASTLYDSMGFIGGKHYFLVSTHTDDPNIFWDSNIDSGYSVDNLPPLAPRNAAGQLAAGTATIHWNPNDETDLAWYEVYRSTRSGFTLDTMKAYTTLRDTLCIDGALPKSASLYYVVRAVDVHGNASPKSNEVRIILVSADVEQGLPRTFALEQNYPNPFNPVTKIRYQIPESRFLKLAVYDPVGREVVVLVNETKGPGRYEFDFDAAHLATGVYIYRMTAGSYVESRKMLVTK